MWLVRNTVYFVAENLRATSRLLLTIFFFFLVITTICVFTASVIALLFGFVNDIVYQVINCFLIIAISANILVKLVMAVVTQFYKELQ